MFLIGACSGSGTPAQCEAPTESTGGEQTFPTVDGEGARALVENGALLLDVTPTARAEASFIEGRTHIPIDALPNRLSELPRDRPIVVYCMGGGASRRAAARLQQEGFDVHYLGAKANWGG